jgi:hypothetical protein
MVKPHSLKIMKKFANFNQELKMVIKSYLTEIIYNKFIHADELRSILKLILSDIWIKLSEKFGSSESTWNTLRFFLKGGTAIIESLDYYSRSTGIPELQVLYDQISKMKLFQGQQSDWDTSIYINPYLSMDEYYNILTEVSIIILDTYKKYHNILNNFFSLSENIENLKELTVMNSLEFKNNIVDVVYSNLDSVYKLAIEKGDDKEIEESKKKLDDFNEKSELFLPLINKISFDVTDNTPFIIQSNREIIGSEYNNLNNKLENKFSDNLVDQFKVLFGCVQELPFMRHFSKYVTSVYAPVLLSINRTITDVPISDEVKTDTVLQFELYRFMLCFNLKCDWKKGAYDAFGFTHSLYFFDHQAELIDISTIPMKSAENNVDKWNALDFNYMVPFLRSKNSNWKDIKTSLYPISNFFYALHDLIITLKDKGKIKKRCQRMFVLYYIICKMNRTVNLEDEFHLKTILEQTWGPKEIKECQDGLKDIKKIVSINSKIALTTLLENPILNSTSCSKIFKSVKSVKCSIEGKEYDSGQLINYTYIYLDKTISRKILNLIPYDNICKIFQTINANITDENQKRIIALDIFNRLKNYELKNILLGDWIHITDDLILLPFLRLSNLNYLNEFCGDIYSTIGGDFLSILKNIIPNQILSSDSYIGPIFDRLSIMVKTMTTTQQTMFYDTLKKENLIFNSFYSYGYEIDIYNNTSFSVFIINKMNILLNSIILNNLSRINNIKFSIVNASNNETELKKDAFFLTSDIYDSVEKQPTIVSISDYIVTTKLISDFVVTINFNLYIKQNIMYENQRKVLTHIVPFMKINMIRKNQEPGMLIEHSALGSNESVLYYKKYEKNMIVDIKKSISSLDVRSHQLYGMKKIKNLLSLYCVYYYFLQNDTYLANLLKINTTETRVINLCDSIKNINLTTFKNFMNELSMIKEIPIFGNIKEERYDSDTEMKETPYYETPYDETPKRRKKKN